MPHVKAPGKEYSLDFQTTCHNTAARPERRWGWASAFAVGNISSSCMLSGAWVHPILPQRVQLCMPRASLVSTHGHSLKADFLGKALVSNWPRSYSNDYQKGNVHSSKWMKCSISQPKKKKKKKKKKSNWTGKMFSHLKQCRFFSR